MKKFISTALTAVILDSSSSAVIANSTTTSFDVGRDGATQTVTIEK